MTYRLSAHGQVKGGRRLKNTPSPLQQGAVTMDDQDENITLTELLGGIWPQNPFMVELAKKTPSTLKEFMNRVDEFVNVEPSRQGRRPKRQLDRNLRLIHNLGVDREEKDREEWHQPRAKGPYYTFHQSMMH